MLLRSWTGYRADQRGRGPVGRVRLREVVEKDNDFASNSGETVRELAFDSEDRGVDFFSQFGTFQSAGSEGLRDRGGRKTWKDRKTWRK